MQNTQRKGKRVSSERPCSSGREVSGWVNGDRGWCLIWVALLGSWQSELSLLGGRGMSTTEIYLHGLRPRNCKPHRKLCKWKHATLSKFRIWHTGGWIWLMQFLYKSEHGTLKPVIVTLRRGMGRRENRGDEPIQGIKHIYMEMLQGTPTV